MGFAMRMQLASEIVRKKSFRNLYINGQKNGFDKFKYLSSSPSLNLMYSLRITGDIIFQI